MTEQIIESQYPLISALNELSKIVGDEHYPDLRSSVIKNLFRNKVGPQNKEFATGVEGFLTKRSRNSDAGERLTWQIRWDWDPQKREHVNLAVFWGGNKKKYAFKSNRPQDLSLYLETLSRFTKDCGYSRKLWEVISGMEGSGQKSREELAYERQLRDSETAKLAARKAQEAKMSAGDAYLLMCAESGWRSWSARLLEANPLAGGGSFFSR